MNIFKRALNGLQAYKKSFFTINQIELTGLSKLLMTLFFLTALWLIASGINSSVRQVVTPETEYGYACQRFARATDMQILDFEKIGNRHNRYYAFGTDTSCQDIEKKYISITENRHIQSEITQVRLLEQKRSNLQYQQKRLDKEYSTMLLEKISDQKEAKSILHSNADRVKEKLKILREKEHALTERIAAKKNILNYPLLQEFRLTVDRDKEGILNGLERAKKYYRLKMSLQVFAFLIPIWLLFYALYRYLAKREKYIFAQLSFYVASAAGLYGLVELVTLIYSIIPKIFLAKLIAFFSSYNMIIVLNILGVLFFLVLFGVIIHKVQKNHEKKRVQKDTKVLNVKRGSCFNCGSRREREDIYCSFCGEELKKVCSACDAQIYKMAPFCAVCGAEQENESR